MATIIKCKMCGGDIETSQDMTVGTCMYCGSTMTLPKIDSERKARIFNRANQYRLNNEFDKAYDAYKTIVNEDEQEAEAYWGMLISEYGVEYVEDPKTKKSIPTCHRTLIQSIHSTTNYQLALSYADAERKLLYQEEADIIDVLQKKIMALSSKEEPYDVFICYKETDDETGERTKDSVLAFDIYERLEKYGLRTFFARITLEDKLGQDYEPYIYSALRSAKVMLVVTTSIEHANAAWVRNEWSRYLDFINQGDDKMIIPVYSDMSPYELPKELSKYQSLDISKVGADQDLTRAIRKKIEESKPKEKEPEIRYVDRQIYNRPKLTPEEIAAKKAEEERIKKERRKRSTIAIPIALLLAVFVAYILYAIPLCYNGHVYLTAYEYVERNIYAENYMLFVKLAVCALGIDFIGFCIGISDGFGKRGAIITFFVGYITFIGALYALINTHLALAEGLWIILIANSVLLLILAVIAFRKKGIIRGGFLVLSAIGAILFLNNLSENAIVEVGNKRNPEIDQIVITEPYVNIRENTEISSDKIGEAYKGQYFDVRNTIALKDWCKIKTASGMDGYINMKNAELVESHENRMNRYVSEINDLLDDNMLIEAQTMLGEMKAYAEEEGIEDEYDTSIFSLNVLINSLKSKISGSQSIMDETTELSKEAMEEMGIIRVDPHDLRGVWASEGNKYIINFGERSSFTAECNVTNVTFQGTYKVISKVDNFIGTGFFYYRDTDTYEENQEMHMRITEMNLLYITIEGAFLNDGKETKLYKCG